MVDGIGTTVYSYTVGNLGRGQLGGVNL